MALFTATVEGLTGTMKKFYPATLKKPKPVRVINPIGIHSARLHARQAIKLVLSPLQSWSQYVSADAKQEVTLSSDYLFIERVEEDNKGQTVYHIGQKYDLSKWAGVSECYLGEIYVDIIGNDHKEAHKLKYDGGTICVFHVPESKNDDAVLTTVNPNEQTIKLEGHRVLEVVLFERDWSNPSCREKWTPTIDDIDVDGQDIQVKILHQATFETKDLGNDKIKHGEFSLIGRHTPDTVNSQLPDKEKAYFEGELSRQEVPARQHHFWLAFTEESRKRIAHLKSGDYACAKIKFEGDAQIEGDHQRSGRTFILMVSKHGKPVSSNTMFGLTTPRLPENKVEREFDRTRCILKNPGNTETVDFRSGFEDVLVEIATPQTYWAEEPSEAKWQITFEGGEDKLDLTHLNPETRSGVTYQRFRVTRKAGAGTNFVESGSLGAIKVLYPPKRNHMSASKRIGFWMNWNTNKRSKSSRAYDVYSCGTGSSGSYSCNGEFKHWKQGLGYFNPNSMKLAVVAIEEVPFTTLADGAHTMKTRYTSYASGNDYNYQSHDTSKKNGSLGSPNSGASRTSGSGGSTTTRTITGTAVGTEAIELFNPPHMFEVTLNPGQPLILRLTPPEEQVSDMLREKCKGEVWTVSPMPVADIKPVIEYQKIVQVGTDKFRQEIKVNPPDMSRLPSASGDCTGGCVKLECSAQNRVVRIRVRKEATERSYEASFKGKFLKDMPTHEANNRKYVYADNWAHGNGVMVGQNEILYVKNPPAVEDFGGEWSVQLIQHGVPGEIWEKMSDRIKQVVDRNRPWFNREYPAEMRGTLVFKPLKDTATNMLATLVEEIGKATKMPYFPVATLVYENVKTEQQEHEDQQLEAIVRVRKELHICVETGYKGPAKVPDAAQSVWWPKNNQEVTIKRGEEVTVNLKPVMTTFGDECEELRWQVASYPTLMEERESKEKHETDKDSFTFRANHPGTGWLAFRCHGRELKLWMMIV